jgi:hypothetical protein
MEVGNEFKIFRPLLIALINPFSDIGESGSGGKIRYFEELSLMFATLCLKFMISVKTVYTSN